MNPQTPVNTNWPGMPGAGAASPQSVQDTPPTTPEQDAAAAASAAELIRQKLNRIYANEPDPIEEEHEAEIATHRSKHQQFMFDLSRSGKSFVQIQTDWHNYYLALPDDEKHQVWQEFYEANSQPQLPQPSTPLPTPTVATAVPVPMPASLTPQKPTLAEPKPTEKPQTVEEIRSSIITRVQTRRKYTKRQHFQSILFGLGMGSIVVFVLLFGFFNDRILAPFMTPSRSVSDASIMIDPSKTKVSDKPQIIIPKINVQIPVVYDVGTIEEAAVQSGLERGVVHYATTPRPGELGNGVIFGHSANNILNKGAYKFAFVLLHKLEIGDIFYIDYNGTRYAYQVFERKIVPPTDVSVLNTTAKPASFTLITCDPPGTNLKRLVLVAEQISPDTTKNTVSTVEQQESPTPPAELPGNAPSLWSRLWSWL